MIGDIQNIILPAAALTQNYTVLSLSLVVVTLFFTLVYKLFRAVTTPLRDVGGPFFCKILAPMAVAKSLAWHIHENKCETS